MRVLAIVLSTCVATTTFCQSSGGVEASSKTSWSSSKLPKAWLDAPLGTFVSPDGSRKEALDLNAGATRKFVFNPQISPALVAYNDETRAMPVAKGQPIPTEWPNLKVEPIPTEWPKLKRMPVSDPQTAHSK